MYQGSHKHYTTSGYSRVRRLPFMYQPNLNCYAELVSVVKNWTIGEIDTAIGGVNCSSLVGVETELNYGVPCQVLWHGKNVRWLMQCT